MPFVFVSGEGDVSALLWGLWVIQNPSSLCSQACKLEICLPIGIWKDESSKSHLVIAKLIPVMEWEHNHLQNLLDTFYLTVVSMPVHSRQTPLPSVVFFSFISL